ncbi:MAG: spermidine synthase, partial [Solirubrobacterales bacterium]
PAATPPADPDGSTHTMPSIRDQRYLLALVFVVGSASLGSEIAAARLLAPFFGASTIVWANTIGVVLVALSIGYAVGGRIADRRPTLRALCTLVLGASILLAIVPFLARPFLKVSAEALDSISAGAFAGSLVGVLAMIAVPVMMLGAASPWAIRLAIPAVDQTGRVAGRMYAVSTAGSLVGTMVSALVLIPVIGTQRTFLLFALAVALISAAGLGLRWFAVPLVIALLMAIPVGTVKARASGEVIYEEETADQYVRVIEQRDGDRLLELNEGQAVHSVTRTDSFLTGGVWDWYLVLPRAVLDRPPKRMAILGNGAGTTARAYGNYFPETEIDGVEIDGELEDIGRRFFDLKNPKLTTHAEDARPFLRRSDGNYDAILVDAYRQPYIPFYLTTVEFFELARDRLAPGGVLLVNVGHPEGNDDLETVLGSTMDEVFPSVRRAPLEQTNTLLVASEGEVSAKRLREQTPDLPRDLRNLAAITAFRLEDRLPGTEVYTDDHAPVEWLIDRSILGYAADQE